MLDLLVTALALAVPYAAASRDVDFAALAESYRRAHGLEGQTQAQIDVDAHLDQVYVRAELGVVDARYPRADVADKSRVRELQEVALALIDVQVRFLEWTGAGNDAESALRKDWASLRKAIAGARPPSWSSVGAPIPGELTAVLGLGPDALALATRVGAAARSGEAFGASVGRAQPIQIVFTPSRRQFVELGAFIGWYDEAARGSFWVEGMPSWADMFWRDRQILPLTYAPAKVSADDLSAGYSMNDREKTGLVEYVAQRGTHSVLWFYFGDRLDTAIESGVALDVPIAVYGQNNARTGSATRGNVTQARSVFIPGAPPKGGFLPRNSADSGWRDSLGADHFVKALRDAQKAGAREAPKDALQHGAFELTSDDTSKHAIVAAPFLGAAAVDKPPPAEEFLQDYAEFYRAYKACFVHWLRTEGAPKGGKKGAEESFARLFRTMLAPAEGTDFESAVQAVYGQPLSSAEPGTPSLESRFLAWLAKQK